MLLVEVLTFDSRVALYLLEPFSDSITAQTENFNVFGMGNYITAQILLHLLGNYFI